MSTDYYTRELVSIITSCWDALITAGGTGNRSAKKAEMKKVAFNEFQKTSETGWDLDNMHINLANIYRAEG